jgi:flavin-dependent dehydrogenase
MKNGTMEQTKQAVVMGASLAGLLAARVLSKHFARVTVLDKDILRSRPDPRDGVPQGRHIMSCYPVDSRRSSACFPALHRI